MNFDASDLERAIVKSVGSAKGFEKLDVTYSRGRNSISSCRWGRRYGQLLSANKVETVQIRAVDSGHAEPG